MLPRDPEREAIGRSIAAMLMAQQIKRTGQVHPATLLIEIGALAGFAVQMSIRKSVIERQQLDANDVLVEVVTKNDEVYYFSDFLNWMLFENMENAPSACGPMSWRRCLPIVTCCCRTSSRS